MNRHTAFRIMPQNQNRNRAPDGPVMLTTVEQKLADHLARCAIDLRLRDGVDWNRVYYSGDRVREWREGFGGELAFCRMANVYPAIRGGMDGRGEYDCVLRSGRTCDVKTVPAGRALNLIAHRHTRPGDADVYVLMECDWPGYRYVGYTTGAALVRRERLRDMGYGVPTYFYERRLLCSGLPE